MSGAEFARPERLDAIGSAPRAIAIEADAGERAALAKRFDIVAIDRLAADFTIRRAAEGIMVEGRVTAGLTQACSVTGEPLQTAIDESVSLRFVAAGTETQDEVELGDDDIDVIPYDGGAIDIGEVAAETVALALDPFPRGPGAEAALKAAGVLSEEEAGPFGALAGLRDKLGK